MSIERLQSLAIAVGQQVSFILSEGPLRNRLIDEWKESLLEYADSDYVDLISDDLSVTVDIESRYKPDEVVMKWECERLDTEEKWGGDSISASLLSHEELHDLANQLNDYVRRANDGIPLSKNLTTVFRRKRRRKCGPDVVGLIDSSSAADFLGVSFSWLKRRIPCSHWEKINLGEEKFYFEYYYDANLLKILLKIRDERLSNEESDSLIGFLTKECCEGDREWAQNLFFEISRLRRTRR